MSRRKEPAISSELLDQLLIARQQAVPNIPPEAKRRWKSCFSRAL